MMVLGSPKVVASWSEGTVTLGVPELLGMVFEVRAVLWALFLQTIRLPKFSSISLVKSISRFFILLDAVVK